MTDDVTPAPQVDELGAELTDYRAANPNVATVVAYMADKLMCQVLAAWSSLPPPTWKRPRSQRPADHASRWAWIWTGADYNPRALADAAGLDLDTTQRLLNAAIRLRLVLPDGKLSEMAEGILYAAMDRSLGKRPAG